MNTIIPRELINTTEPVRVKKGLPRIIHRNGHSLDNRRPNLLVLPDLPHLADGKIHAVTKGVDGRDCYIEHVIMGFDNPDEPAQELEEECVVKGEGLEHLGSPFGETHGEDVSPHLSN